MTKKILNGQALEDRCNNLGIDIQGDLIFQSASGRFKRAGDHELQQRLSEYERSRRDSNLWVLAVISAIASMISAATAIIAVLQNNH